MARADRASFNAAVTLGLTLPGDTLLYLLLPLYAGSFGVSLAEAGILLAVNRLIRIFAYAPIARFYSARGPRIACLIGAFGSILAVLTYVFGTGLWPLLIGRLTWGLSYAAMNIANQSLPTSVPSGAAPRAARSRVIIALGPALWLVAGALMAAQYGPRSVFMALTVAACLAPFFAAAIPKGVEAAVRSAPQIEKPGPISLWSFASGFTIDGLFIFGLGLLAAGHYPKGAVLAAGLAMALRYAAEILFAPIGGQLAHRYSSRRIIILASFAATASLAALAGDGVLLWCGAIGTIVLRAMSQPLIAPMVAEAFPGPERVAALARQSTWRDIGAGLGPLAAGFLLPLLPIAAVYGCAALLLFVATLLLTGTRKSPVQNPLP